MVLSADLVRARRRGDELKVTELKGAELPEVERMGEAMLFALQANIGENFEEVEAALNQVSRVNKLEKVWAGFKKILLDACEFSDSTQREPIELRQKLFSTAAEARLSQSAQERFDRDAVLRAVAKEFEMTAESLESALYSDLKGAKRLLTAPRFGCKELVFEYEKQHIQGVLLRAVRISCELHCADAEELRRLFRKLKFRQLLFRIEEFAPQSYRIEIDGPFSLFEAVTKYGLQFALVLPILMECERGKLSAELRWGKERKSLTYEKSWTTPRRADSEEKEWLRPELRALIAAIKKKKTPWKVEPWGEVMNIPGVGVCVSDLKFSAQDRKSVYLELMGFWSRDAVWQRVEWAQSGQHERVIFAASSRLRVSEEVLPPESGGSLYVFKGAMSAVAVLKQVEELASRSL